MEMEMKGNIWVEIIGLNDYNCYYWVKFDVTLN